MKINRLETHDRYLHFQKQWEQMAKGLQDCIKNVPDDVDFPFYVFAHSRTVDFSEKSSLMMSGSFNDPSQLPTKRFIWAPRVTKPKAQTNSYLFLCEKKSDIVKIIWAIPPRELWEQFEPGKMSHNETIWVSIQNFIHHKELLETPEKDGPTHHQQQRFRRIIGAEAHRKKQLKSMPDIWKKL